jgi:hypothetical protein
LPLLSSIIGIVLSGLIAFLVSKRQTRYELIKIRLQIDASYRGKLSERRLAVYPEIARHLAELSRAIRSGSVPTSKVRHTWNVVREWDGANSIFMSPLAMTSMIALKAAHHPLSIVRRARFQQEGTQ